MGQSSKCGVSVVALSFVCFLGISCGHKVTETIPDESVHAYKVATNQMNFSLESSFVEFPISDTSMPSLTTKPASTSTNLSRKHIPKKDKKSRKRKEGHPAIGISQLQSNEIASEIVTNRTTTTKRTIGKRRRRNRKRRRKTKPRQANILEIVEARGSSHPTSESKLKNSLINEIREKLNKNPELSLNELGNIRTNKTLNFSSDEFWLDNWVDIVEIPKSLKSIGHPAIGISPLQSNEIASETVTNRTPTTKRTIGKRRRSNRKRRRKTRPRQANILEIGEAKGSSHPTSESKLNNSLINEIREKLNKNPELSLNELGNIRTNKTLNFSSDEFWLDNWVDIVEIPKSLKSIESSTTLSPLQSNERITENVTLPGLRKLKNKRRRRRRKNKNRGRRLKPRNGKKNEVATARESLVPEKSRGSVVNTSIQNMNHIYPNSTFSSTGIWLENLVAPVPKTAGMPTLLNDTMDLRTNGGNSSRSDKYNRCRKNRGGCAHICNPRGPNKCSCLEGFFLAKDRRKCYDMNECKIDNGGCEWKCVNTLGSYECQCPKGLRLADDMKSCEDINECLLRNGHGPCQDTCENTFSSYKCGCARLNGTKLSENGYSCEDINECSTDNGGCSHECINTIVGAFCNCPYGLELSSDRKTCQDINECEDEDIRRNCGGNCINTVGSYECLPDFQNDQPLNNFACKPLFPPAKGYISCSRMGAYKSYTQDGRERTTNSPGTTCELICPVGFKMFGKYHVICDLYGKWNGSQEGECKRAPPAQIQCPPSKHFKLEKGEDEILVRFPSPVTNINWKYVKANPPWARDLMKTLGRGEYNINFTVRDPSTKTFSSCSFDIIVSSI